MSEMLNVDTLFEAACEGDAASTGRLLTTVEAGGSGAREVARRLQRLKGGALVVGVTGPPGAGKSTLVSRLARQARLGSARVAILAIDPSSARSGGALLGDRVRMTEHLADESVFVRSIGARGHLGGVSLAAPELIRVMEAVGYGVVFVETVGVGQAEIDICRIADVVVLVTIPGSGDDIQAAKAGLLEHADILVVNKSDLPGAQQTVRDLTYSARLRQLPPRAPRPPVLQTVATTTEGGGVAELWKAIRTHGDAARHSAAARRSERLWWETSQIVRQRRRAEEERLLNGPQVEQLRVQLVSQEVDPWTAADALLEHLRGQGSGNVVPCGVSGG